VIRAVAGIIFIMEKDFSPLVNMPLGYLRAGFENHSQNNRCTMNFRPAEKGQ
jgi:hypothetical protein